MSSSRLCKWLAALAILAVAAPVFAQEEEAGNNLSFPVIWSGGTDLTLPGVFGAPVLTVPYDPQAVPPIYPQRTEGNTWQAESDFALALPVYVDTVDVGDNLEAKSWPASTVLLRTEFVLSKTLTDPMTAFNMIYLEGQGPDELWGTDGATYDSYEATVYTPNARVLIHALPAGVNPAAVVWSGGTWTVNGAALSNPVNEAATAEINVKGKVIYGYNWRVAELGLAPGTYRVTFILDEPTETSLAIAEIYQGEEEVAGLGAPSGERGPGSGGGGGGGGGGPPSDKGKPGGGGVAVIRPDLNLVFIDVTLTKTRGGGR
jgi:hypothetical protein